MIEVDVQYAQIEAGCGRTFFQSAPYASSESTDPLAPSWQDDNVTFHRFTVVYAAHAWCSKHDESQCGQRRRQFMTSTRHLTDTGVLADRSHDVSNAPGAGSDDRTVGASGANGGNLPRNCPTTDSVHAVVRTAIAPAMLPHGFITLIRRRLHAGDSLYRLQQTTLPHFTVAAGSARVRVYGAGSIANSPSARFQIPRSQKGDIAHIDAPTQERLIAVSG